LVHTIIVNAANRTSKTTSNRTSIYSKVFRAFRVFSHRKSPVISNESSQNNDKSKLNLRPAYPSKIDLETKNTRSGKEMGIIGYLYSK
jgi:hypothetical protein